MSETDALPPSGWADLLFRLSGPEIRKRAVTAGATEAVALRLSQLVGALTEAAKGPLTFAELMLNPEKALAALDAGGALSVLVTEDERNVFVPVRRLDLALLVGLLLDRAAPRWARGADLYARFAHSGRPHPIAMNPPPEPPYRTPTLEDALRGAPGETDEAGEGEKGHSVGPPSRRTAEAGTTPLEPGTRADGEDGSMTPDVLDKVGPLLARVYAKFGPDTGWWLGVPNQFLDNLSPLACLATPEGRRRLDEVLTRLELGVYI